MTSSVQPTAVQGDGQSAEGGSCKPLHASDHVAKAVASLGSDPRDAMRLAEQALTTPGLSPGLRLDAMRVQGVAHHQLGQLAEALAVFSCIQPEAHRLGDVRREARAWADVGVIQLFQGQLECALQALATAISMAGPGTELALIAFSNVGLIAEQVAEYHLFLEFTQSAIAGMATSPQRTTNTINCAVALTRLERFDEARRYLEDALAQCDHSVVSINSIAAHSLIFWLDVKCGHGERAATQLEMLIATAMAHGLKVSEFNTRMILGEVQMMQGMYARAVATVESCKDLTVVCGASLEIEVANWLSKCFAELGRWQEAYQTLLSVKARARTTASMHEHFLLARRFINARGARTPVPGNETQPTNQSISALARKVGMSPTDVDLLKGVTRGLSNREIAEQVGLSAYTVRNRLARVMRKLGVNSRAAAATKALELEIVKLRSV